MKRPLSLLVFTFYLLPLWAQPSTPGPVKVVKNANHFVYEVYEYGEKIDTQYTQIEVDGGSVYLVSDGRQLRYGDHYLGNQEEAVIPGYSVISYLVDTRTDTITTVTAILGGERPELYRTLSPYARKDIQFDTDQVNGLTRYTCSLNSNKLEFYVQPHTSRWGTNDLSPVPYYGRFPGLLVSFWRNGQCRLQLVDADKPHSSKFYMPNRVPVVTARELSHIKRERMVITTRIFDSVQLCWGLKNDHIEGDYRENTPFDSVLHFAGGTLALKRIQLPVLPRHYQTFIELHQRSNGDAYDRTGSVFVIPGIHPDLSPNFFDGINNHPDSLPLFFGRDGQKYQGIKPGISHLRQYLISSFLYWPPIELMRFFTPFGVGHFNDRLSPEGLVSTGGDNPQWQEETYYKQEVTDLAECLQGEVWIGVWIGNYDKGGHIVTLDLKSYPNDSDSQVDTLTSLLSPLTPLFNTCNVLEMAGQNYGKLFATDSLTTEFSLWGDTNRHVKLRYIATGHGGWDGGDEFNPKTHTILIDGQEAFTYTPWRSDCGRYREWNPVSGNFWNGLSSSDYSRSGWCPGTATQPVYFDLTEYFRKHHLPIAGRHTITVTIPQGEPQAGSFSHWCVSGVLVTE